MFKQINSQASTKQIRKTKLLDSYHNNATNTLRNKIMLTDLCPEQKAKIGDLVRTLETRKSQNNTLEQRIKQLQKRQKKHVDKIQQLQKIIQEGRQKQLKLKEQLTLVKIKEQERQRYIQHLLAEKQQKQQQLLKIKKVACVDQFSLTDPVITFNQGVQAIPKKKKQKQTQVQTQINNMNQQGKRYPNNSRSFQKIMRGARVHSHGNQANSAARSGNKNKFKDDKNRLGQRFKKSQIIINDQQDEQNQQIQSQENNQQVQLNQDDDFNQLAKKWLELKQKNMSKIKQSYKKSKQKVSNDKSIKKISKSIAIPRQFNQKVVPQHQEQEQSFTNHENNLHHNQSFGPKKSKKKQRRKQTQQIQEQGNELDKDFDQIQLNKILKLKNFSASRLLSKNHQLSSQQSDRQKQKYNRYQNDKRQQKKLKKSNNMRIQQHQNTPNMKISGVSNSRSNNIDFYETDLLDIVSSINRK